MFSSLTQREAPTLVIPAAAERRAGICSNPAVALAGMATDAPQETAAKSISRQGRQGRQEDQQRRAWPQIGELVERSSRIAHRASKQRRAWPQFRGFGGLTAGNRGRATRSCKRQRGRLSRVQRSTFNVHRGPAAALPFHVQHSTRIAAPPPLSRSAFNVQRASRPRRRSSRSAFNVQRASRRRRRSSRSTFIASARPRPRGHGPDWSDTIVDLTWGANVPLACYSRVRY